MKERHWTSLVTSLRHGQCVLMLGQEGSATPAEADRAGSRNDGSFAEALMRRLADELEEDGRRVIGDSLAAVAQQYEDAAGFGTNALRARAEKFYNSGALAPSALHRGLASLPFGLSSRPVTTISCRAPSRRRANRRLPTAIICAATSAKIRNSL